ncbi:AraC family transcriptional regulator [Paenibacillus sp. XY044]|uniref:helix-turn-helix transcriptional regulator n=1 Tax=Paenibacillus sp. XY044 TaxID=2026089 RepID=UPI00211B1566|nr:AraC family transcriptional regulator [Paenibacillus sp. XY044]
MIDFANLHPYVYNASRYLFSKGQNSISRVCYASSLYLISEGKGMVHFRGEDHPVGPGSLVYMPPGLLHDWYANQEQPMIHYCCYFDWKHIDRREAFLTPNMICFDTSQLQSSLIGPSFPVPIPEYMTVGKLQIWIDWFETFFINNEYTNERTYYRGLKIQSNFQQFMEYFLTFALKKKNIPDPRVLKILERLDHDLMTGNVKPLEFYFRELRISRGYFFELFHQATGLSPIQYMNQFRINRAKDDLRFSNISITEISEKYGFSSVHYFSKLFKQLTGMPPKEYREAYIREEIR